MDRQIVENAVRDYSGSLLKVAYAYTNNTCDAEDIVQETFLSLMTEKKKFLSQEHMKAWLIRVTINTEYFRVRGKERNELVRISGNRQVRRNRRIL